MAASRRPDGLLYPFPTPEFDELVELAPGVRWLRTPLPFALDHINIWVFDNGRSWTVVDAGVGNAATAALWQRLLATELAGKPVRSLLVTHFHPDHFGHAGPFCAHTGARLLMPRTEWLMGRALALDTTEGFVVAGERLDRLAGLDEELVQARRERGNLYRRNVPEPPPVFQRVEAGQVLNEGGRSWRVLIGEGHAPEQATLVAEDGSLLIAADQVLPRITPIVGVWAMCPEEDPLGHFLHSLEQYRTLPEDTLVLPSHGLPFKGLRKRLDQLPAHHEERLARTLDLLATPTTAASVMRGLFERPLTLQDTGFALAETLAHLNCLLRRGEVQRDEEAGRYWFARA